MSNPLLRSATGAADAIRRNEVLSRDLTEAILARTADLDPAINAVRSCAARTAQYVNPFVARNSCRK